MQTRKTRDIDSKDKQKNRDVGIKQKGRLIRERCRQIREEDVNKKIERCRHKSKRYRQ